MIEMILTLFVLSICAMLSASLVSLIQPKIVQDHAAEDDTAIMQLQLIFAQANSMKILNALHVSLDYHLDTVSLERYEDKLVKRPGFEVLLQDLDDLYFYQESNCIALHWSHKEIEHDAILGCE